MEITGPKIKSTICSPDSREWIPSSLANLLLELEHITETNQKDDSLTLFRGQSNSNWPLDSTFLRDSITKLFGLRNYQLLSKKTRNQVAFHRAIASLLLLKFGSVWRPSTEAFDKEKCSKIDPWYELLKNMQQYPENYTAGDFIKGTTFTDWTDSQDIALYFATFDGNKSERQIRPNGGAVWVYDASHTGNILQEEKLEKILGLMASPDFLNGVKTFPLIFHPQSQTIQQRATNQKPIYIAQMDFRYDLAEVWASYEMRSKEKVFIKINILESVKYDLAKHLKSKGITEEHVYPH